MKRLWAAALALASVAVAVVVVGTVDTGGDSRAIATTWSLDLIDAAAVKAMPAAGDRLELYQQRSIGRPPTATDQRLLGSLLLQQAIESGDDGLFEAVEEEYRVALAMAPDDVANQLGLASALAAQHRFGDAADLIEAVLELQPDNIDALAAMGDAYLSLGRYDEAAAAHQELARLVSAPAATARLAHLEELHGNPQRALELLESAALEMHLSDALADDLAWYLTRLAELYFQTGNLEASARHAEVALEVAPRTLFALGQLARARASQGRLDEAISASERLVAQQPHPELLGQLGDLYALAGKQGEAADLYDQVIGIAPTAGSVEDRPLGRFLADHDIEPEQALRRAERDVVLRPDIEAHDLHAWALYRNGRFEEAAEAIDRALRLGTRRADFYYHAGLIYGALGDIDRSISLLQDALAINRQFDPLHAPIAREALESRQAAGAR